MGKIEIPGGFEDGCAIAIKSDQEIWLIGGFRTGKRILSFDVESHTFKVLPFSAILMLALLVFLETAAKCKGEELSWSWS